MATRNVLIHTPSVGRAPRGDAGAERLHAMLDRLEATSQHAESGVTARLHLSTLGYRPSITAVSNMPRADVTIPIRLLETAVVVGCPWSPGAPGPCPDCLDRRWLEARSDFERELLEQPGDALQFGTFPLLTDFALNVIAAVLGSVADRVPDRDIGEVIHFDLVRMTLTRHALQRSSDCRCSPPNPDTSDASELALVPRPKRDPSNYRLKRAEDLALPVDALTNRLCGVLGVPAPDHSVTATAPVTGYFRSRSKFGLHRCWWSGHAESYGSSKLLGLLEGLERYAGQYPRSRSVSVIAPASALADEFLDPREYPQYRGEFYHSHSEHYAKWTPDMECSWVWGHSLKNRRPILVPEQLAYYLHRDSGRKYFVQESSNGCAAASTLEEAILHGLLELVERDAFLLTWYGKLVPREIDMRSITSSLTNAMRARVELLGYDLRCFDIRVDIDSIPVVAAVAVRRDGGLGSLCFAAGSSLNPEDAVRAAVCEVASYVPSFEARLRSTEPAIREMVADFSLVRDLEHHSLLYGLPEMRRYAAFMLDHPARFDLHDLYWKEDQAPPRRDDLTSDLDAVAREIMDLGSDVIVVDQTPPEQRSIGIHTVCTLAPGLLPIDFGWIRQRALVSRRLREAPFNAGLRKEPLSDDQINWAPHPFP